MSRYSFALSYEITPIVLIGGIASNLPSQMLPIIALTEQENYDNGLVNGTLSINENDYFAKFKVLPGSKLKSNSIGMYAFANQQAAANAIVFNPLTVSVLMIAPAKGNGGYITKSQKITQLKKSLDIHDSQGGMYNIVTPAFTYTNCILSDIVDVSSGESKQVQSEYRFDFIKPVLTLEDAASAYNSLMNSLNSGYVVTPNANGEIAWSGSQLTSNQTGGSTWVTTGNLNSDAVLINPNIQNLNGVIK